MFSSFLAKGALGILGIGTAAAGAVYFGKDLIADSKDKISVRELIKTTHPHKRLITGKVVSDQYWKDSWRDYRNAHLNKDLDSWKLREWFKPTATVDNSSDASAHFIDACFLKAEEEVEGTSDLLYSQVLSYCTRDALISDLIREKNPSKTLLSDSDGDKWKAPWEAYKNANKDKWKLSDWDQRKNEVNVPETFKNECKQKLGTKTSVAENGDYEDVLNWCTN
ncbi:hypothetical protein HF1_02470 [Mycoplasma haemofelis str. Langford 1]|uniref:Uncharacterized protein n=1 Tax=Mycoplasma haemofelis (strain Langford 1) TaxID=941640 RepID=E8ZKT9_MYCHL|nr:hypothetical protein [Mycoplasma haemofelis]CBY92255.1 hypothetical protein HF1_02470 [Mycoplasma haemofelis str. Langford 1]